MAKKFTPKSGGSGFNPPSDRGTDSGKFKSSTSKGYTPKSDKQTQNNSNQTNFSQRNNSPRFGSNKFNTPQQEPEAPKKEKKPRKPVNKKKLYSSLAVVLLLSGGAFYGYHTYIDTGLSKAIEYNQSKDKFFTELMSTWGTPGNPDSYNKSVYAKMVNTPYFNQELDYFNRDSKKMKYFQFILHNTSFVPQKDKLKTRQGKTEIRLSDYDSNKYTFSIPDYSLIEKRALTTDYQALQQVYKQRKLSKDDYNYDSKMTNLFMDYMMSLKDLPTKEVKVSLQVSPDGSSYKIMSDQNLDNILFASNEFHSLQDTVSAIANSDIGVLKDNPQHKAWEDRKEKYNEDETKLITDKVKQEIQDSKDKSKDSSSDSNKEETKATKSSSNQEKTNKRTKQIIKEADQTAKETEKQMSQDVKEYEQDQYSEMLRLKGFFGSIQTLQDTPKDGNFVTKSVSDQEEDFNTEYTKKAKALNDSKELKDKALKQDKEEQDLKTLIDKLSEPDKDPKQQSKQDKDLKDAQTKLDNLHIEQSVTETKQQMGSKEEEASLDLDKLSKQEKAIGIEPPKKVFVRKQIDNPEWGTWNLLHKDTTIPEPPKTVNEPLKPQQNINYKWIGAYYLQHNYKDKEGNKQVIKPQHGDGTFKYPATIGTTVQTKAHDKKGNLHDVKVILEKVLIDKDAIKYTQALDDRNEGFDSTADNKLVAIQFKVLNLENKDLTLESGFQLTDKDGNPISRNGTMYSIKNELNIKAKSADTMQDWFYTKDPEALYLVWGKDQEKVNYKWFDTLQFQSKQVSNATDQ